MSDFADGVFRERSGRFDPALNKLIDLGSKPQKAYFGLLGPNGMNFGILPKTQVFDLCTSTFIKTLKTRYFRGGVQKGVINTKKGGTPKKASHSAKLTRSGCGWCIRGYPVSSLIGDPYCRYFSYFLVLWLLIYCLVYP